MVLVWMGACMVQDFMFQLLYVCVYYAHGICLPHLVAAQSTVRRGWCTLRQETQCVQYAFMAHPRTMAAVPG